MKVQMNSARCSGCVFHRPAVTLKSGLVLDEECGRKCTGVNPDETGCCPDKMTIIQLIKYAHEKHETFD